MSKPTYKELEQSLGEARWVADFNKGELSTMISAHDELEQQLAESVVHCNDLRLALGKQLDDDDDFYESLAVFNRTEKKSLLLHDARVIENLIDSMTELSQSPYLPDTLLTGATFTVVNEWGKAKAEELREQAK